MRCRLVIGSIHAAILASTASASPGDVGACCLADGTCIDVDEAVCAALEGLFLEGLTCVTACPPQPAGCNSAGVGVDVVALTAFDGEPAPRCVILGQVIEFVVGTYVREDSVPLVFCDAIAGQLLLTLPDGMPVEVAGYPDTPSIPQFGNVLGSGTGPFFTQVRQTYVVDPADADDEGVLVSRGDLGQTLSLSKMGVEQDSPIVLSDPPAEGAGELTRRMRLCMPEIALDLMADPDTICSGRPTDVVLTFLVANPGEVNLVVGDLVSGDCRPGFVRGDDDRDGLVDPGEVWVYECTVVISRMTSSIAVVSANAQADNGELIGGARYTYLDSAVVKISADDCPPAPASNEASSREGACCLPDGSCSWTSRPTCAEAGGLFRAGRRCDRVECPRPRGACCLPGRNCEFTDEPECLARGGTYRGSGTVCTPRRCAASWLRFEGHAAEGAGGPIGACCDPNNTCFEIPEVDCSAIGGVYVGDGVECLVTTCLPVPPDCDAASVGAELIASVDGDPIPPVVCVIPGVQITYFAGVHVSPPMGPLSFCDGVGGQIAAVFPGDRAPLRLVRVAGYPGTLPVSQYSFVGGSFLTQVPEDYLVRAEDVDEDGFLNANVEYGPTTLLFLNGLSQESGTILTDVGEREIGASIGRATGFCLPAVASAADATTTCIIEGETLPITFIREITNPGEVDLTDVVVESATCPPVFVGGDDGSDGVLAPGEIWLYECTMDVSEPLIDEAVVTAAGIAFNGTVIDDPEFQYSASSMVVVDFDVEHPIIKCPPGPGFFPDQILLPSGEVPGLAGIVVAGDDCTDPEDLVIGQSGPLPGTILDPGTIVKVEVTVTDQVGRETSDAVVLCATIPGDTDCDGAVDVDDIITVVLNWNQVCPMPLIDPCIGDVTGDDVVNVDDLIAVVLGWNPG